MSLFVLANFFHMKNAGNLIILYFISAYWSNNTDLWISPFIGIYFIELQHEC